MLGHYLTFAIRKFARTPVTAALNILGLAVGLACFMAAIGTASYWSLSDSHFSNADRTFVVTQKFEWEDRRSGYLLSTARPVGVYLKEDFPELEAVARFLPAGERTAIAGDRKLVLWGAGVEQDFLKIFDFEFVEGDVATALNTPGTVILTETAARRLFGDEPALGKEIRFSRWGGANSSVSGVIKAPKPPSHLGDSAANLSRFDFLHGWHPMLEHGNWRSVDVRTYILFSEDKARIAPDQMNNQLAGFVERRIPERQRESGQIYLKLVPLSGLLSHSMSVSLLGESSDRISMATIFFLLGLLVLAVACINYANLATAQTAGRGKEIGMRKMVGASQFQLFIQYWSEALIFAALAAILALLLVWAVNPVITNMVEIINPIAGLLSGITPLLVVTVVIIAASFVACLYPVFILSRIRPVEALRSGSLRAGPKVIMRLLVGVQFAIASLFLIVLIVMAQQNALLRSEGLPQSDPVVILEDDASRLIGYEALAADFADDPEIVAVTQIDYTPYSGYVNSMFFSTQLDSFGPSVTTYINRVGYDFFSIFDATVLAGRVFDRERNDLVSGEFAQKLIGQEVDLTESNQAIPAVIDRAASDQLGFSSPNDAVGQTIFYSAEARVFDAQLSNFQFEIIGVVESMPLQFSALGVSANIYFLVPPPPSNALFGTGLRPVVQLSRENASAALELIRNAVEARDPDALVSIRFLDEAFEIGFQSFGRIPTVISGLSLVAFAIAVFGLFAMAAYVAGRRRHEIGVRKTLGASTSSVVALLLRDFTMPVLIGNLIAWPLAYFAANAYVGQFISRIDLTPLPWLLGLALTIAIAWLAVGGQAWRAARVNPADVLRNE